MTHRELINGCARGNKTAQDELYNTYAGRLFAVCLRYTRNRMDAEDLLQEAWVKIYRNIHTIRRENEKKLYPWMRRVMINLTLNYLRDQKHYGFSEDIDQYSDQWGAEVNDEELQPLFETMKQEEIGQMISALPDGYRTVFNMYVFEEFTHQEIADSLGISVNTSKTQLMKARKALIVGIQKKITNEPKYKQVI